MSNPCGLKSLNLAGDALSEALGLTLGEDYAPDWRLERLLPHHEGGTLIVFVSATSRHTVGLQVRIRDDAALAWRRTHHLDVITHIPEDLDSEPLLVWLGSLVDRLSALDGPDCQIDSPSPAGDIHPPVAQLDLSADMQPEALSPFAFGRVFVLDLDSDCGQRCTFCSTRLKMSPRTHFDGAERSRLLRGMERARIDGYDVLRISGLDPLWHPDIAFVVREAKGLGFSHLHIYSPFTRLADDGFFEEFWGALEGQDFTLHVPIYGPDAQTHDAVTGVSGSFDRVLKSLNAIDAQVGGHLNLLTVVTDENLHVLPEIRALFSRWKAAVQVFLPFPSTRDDDDAFFRVSLPQRALVGAMCACDPPMGLSELLPCVRFSHEVKTGEAALTTGGFHPTTAALGTLFQHADYRRVDDAQGNTFTIPVRACPHASDCALAAVCPKSVYEAYANRFGLEELQPVDVTSLQKLAPQIAAFIQRM